MWSRAIGGLVCLSALSLLACGAEPVPIIDEEINAALKASNLTAAPRAAETELVRRVYLDILGRIPTPQETVKFLDDKRGDKLSRLIDELLVHDEMPVYWRHVFDEWLNGSVREREFGRDRFLDYLEHALKTNKPWHVMAREMIVPDLGDERQRQAAYFLATRLRGDNAAKIDSMTSGVASAFFGVQLQCAKCHDHPSVPQWKQDHYYGLAAFLGRTQEARFKDLPIVKENADGEVKFMTTSHEEKTAKLLFLDGRAFEEPEKPADRRQWYAKGQGGMPDQPIFSRRKILADYAFTAESRYFKRAIVNRIWKQLMGRGLVEPVDQMHEANPASHNKLLDRLADDFAAHNFDLRRLMASILHSAAYARSSRWTGGSERPAERTYATAMLKPLAPEQLATSIGVATGHFDLERAKLERNNKKNQPGELNPARLRALYARSRDFNDFVARFQHGGAGFEANAGQALFLSYNQLMQKQLQPVNGNLVDRLAKHRDPTEATHAAFLTILSRLPDDGELERTVEFLSGGQQNRYQELAWALLCSAEFRFNH